MLMEAKVLPRVQTKAGDHDFGVMIGSPGVGDHPAPHVRAPLFPAAPLLWQPVCDATEATALLAAKR